MKKLYLIRFKEGIRGRTAAVVERSFSDAFSRISKRYTKKIKLLNCSTYNLTSNNSIGIKELY